MKKSLKLGACTFVLAMLVSCGQKEKTVANYGVIPLPQKTELIEGNPFVLNSTTKIVYPESNDDLKRIASFLSEYIHFTTGKVLSISTEAELEEGRGNIISLQSNLVDDNAEAYDLKVSTVQIVVNGASEAGTFYGVQTLRKSIDAYSDGKDVSFPLVEISDYPRFQYRGMHLDVGRHMFPVSFIKEYIDILALHNINRFHWHLTDDQGWRIEIKKYPELTEKGSTRKHTVIGRNSGQFDNTPYGGFYTQEEAREIVKYAQDRFITIIPEVDLPGHMLGALTAYPNLGCTGGPYELEGQWGVFDDVLCAGNEEIYPFLENVFTEIMDIFPSKYIHVGGDECPKTRWKECPKCQSKIKKEGLKADAKHTAEDRLQSYVIARIEKFLNDNGREIIGWDEILEGGLAPNATVMSWRGVEGAIEAAKQGHDAIMTPNPYLYFDYYQTTDVDNVPLAIGGYIPLDKVYHFNPLTDELSAEEAKHIIGVQANLWTEYITSPQQVEYMIMPRIDALSEVQWTMPDKKEYDSFIQRLFRMIALYNKKGYNYSKSIFDVNASVKPNTENGTIEVSLSTIDNAPIYYTLDGSNPNDKSSKYTSPIILSKSTQLKAVAIRKEFSTPIYIQDFYINKATMKPVSVNKAPHKSYTFEGATALVDGIWGNKGSYKDGTWLGFVDGNIEIVIDLKEKQEISEVAINNFVCTGDWIFGTKSLTISLSDDGVAYTQIARDEYPLPTDHYEGIVTNKVTFNPVKTRYVKVLIDKVDQMPAWHAGAGRPAFLFLDEVVIN